MCQQTQVETVKPYYTRWLKSFPTLASLAKADVDRVREHWAGLGYYSRATRLHEGAKTVMRDHKGHIPTTAAGLVKLPGIGPYMCVRQGDGSC